MASKEIALELAAFVDSEAARALDAPDEAVRSVGERFLEACYEDLGKAPRFLDGQDVHVVVGHLMADRFALRDPHVEHAPAILEAFLAHLETMHVISQSFELRQALAPAAEELREVVRTGQSAHGHHHGHAAPKQDPFVHGAPKLGRNDPCSCGSGKKYKKCHGR